MWQGHRFRTICWLHAHWPRARGPSYGTDVVIAFLPSRRDMSYALTTPRSLACFPQSECPAYLETSPSELALPYFHQLLRSEYDPRLSSLAMKRWMLHKIAIRWPGSGAFAPSSQGLVHPAADRRQLKTTVRVRLTSSALCGD